MNPIIRQILNSIMQERNLDFSGYHPGMLTDRIQERMDLLKFEATDAYSTYLKKHPDEYDHLLNALIVTVSRFFRHPLTFEIIEEIVMPAIIQKKRRLNDSSIRVWSAGCATGEEPYSAAILLEAILTQKDIHLDRFIFATDIDDNALHKAKSGMYSEESVKNIKYGLLKTYFEQPDDVFLLNSKIRKAVSFSTYDMLDQKRFVPAESVFGTFDLVFCRNLLIYYTKEYQKIIFKKLIRSLDHGGFLILGEFEMLSTEFLPEFEKIQECCKIYRKH